MNLILRNSSLSPTESELNRFVKEFFNQEISPAIELSEDKGHIYLRAELPGVEKEHIDIQVAEDYVSISGEYKNKSECKDEEGRVYRSEFRQGNFIRTVPLPEEINHKSAKAELKDGILTITLPKLEERKESKLTTLKL